MYMCNNLVQVIGARHLRKGTSGQISPFVEIEIIGVDKDCQKSKTNRQGKIACNFF